MTYDILLFIQLHNQIRQANHLPLLTRSQGLTISAELRAEEIQEKFGHTRPNGEAWSTVDCSTSKFLAENLSKGFDSEKEAMKALMNSPSHRKNILNSKYTKIGVYCKEKYCAYWYSN